MTGVVAKYMMEHTMENEIQLGALEGVLGTIHQLIIDQCIMEEVKQYHRNLAVTFYNYNTIHSTIQ